jgi:hypothetical protein
MYVSIHTFRWVCFDMGMIRWVCFVACVTFCLVIGMFSLVRMFRWVCMFRSLCFSKLQAMRTRCNVANWLKVSSNKTDDKEVVRMIDIERTSANLTVAQYVEALPCQPK